MEDAIAEITLADRLEAHTEQMANTSWGLTMQEWNVISNDILLAARTLRALDEALAKLERYDDALDEIAAHYNGGITGPGRLQADSMRDIARAALKDTP